MKSLVNEITASAPVYDDEVNEVMAKVGFNALKKELTPLLKNKNLLGLKSKVAKESEATLKAAREALVRRRDMTREGLARTRAAMNKAPLKKDQKAFGGKVLPFVNNSKNGMKKIVGESMLNEFKFWGSKEPKKDTPQDAERSRNYDILNDREKAAVIRFAKSRGVSASAIAEFNRAEQTTDAKFNTAYRLWRKTPEGISIRKSFDAFYAQAKNTVKEQALCEDFILNKRDAFANIVNELTFNMVATSPEQEAKYKG